MQRVNPVLLVLIHLQENGQCLGVKYFNNMEIQICSLAAFFLSMYSTGIIFFLT